MGLFTLLSVSKSLRVARDMPHRYRTRRRALLPKFEPAARTQIGQDVMKTETNNETGKVPVAEPPAEVGQVVGSKAVLAHGAPRTVRRTGAARAWWDIGGWLSLERWGLRRPVRAVKPDDRPREPMQPELALENIKPCRNDLRDADWDVAPPPASGARLAFLKNLAGSGTSGSRAARGASVTSL